MAAPLRQQPEAAAPRGPAPSPSPLRGAPPAHVISRVVVTLSPPACNTSHMDEQPYIRQRTVALLLSSSRSSLLHLHIRLVCLLVLLSQTIPLPDPPSSTSTPPHLPARAPLATHPSSCFSLLPLHVRFLVCLLVLLLQTAPLPTSAPPPPSHLHLPGFSDPLSQTVFQTGFQTGFQTVFQTATSATLNVPHV